MVLKIQKFFPAWGLSDPSPFCIKLESFLKFANINYEEIPFDPQKSLGQAPKGKIPYAFLEDGRIMGDSTLLIEHLSETQNIDLDKSLSAEQRAISHAFRRMLDENLYWIILYSRWFDEPGWEITRNMIFGSLPAFMRGPISWIQNKGVKKSTIGHGIGRHSKEEIYEIGRKDLAALSELLGKEKYFFGMKKPTLLDIWAHAYVISITRPPIDSVPQQMMKNFSNLAKHADHMQALIYGDQESSAQKEAA